MRVNGLEHGVFLVERKGIEPSTFALRRPKSFINQRSYWCFEGQNGPFRALSVYKGSTQI